MVPSSWPWGFWLGALGAGLGYFYRKKPIGAVVGFGVGAVSGAIIGTMRDAQHSALPPSSGGSGGAGATINVSVRPGNLGTFNVVSQSSVPIGQTSTLLNFTLPDGSSRFTGFTSTNNQVLLSQTSFGSSVAYTTSANFAGTSNLVITWTDGNGVTQTSTATVVAT